MDKLIEDPRLARANRAIQALAAGMMKVSPFILGKAWVVESQSRFGTHEYLVLNDEGQWQCSCPDWQARNEDCKHILAVKLTHARHI